MVKRKSRLDESMHPFSSFPFEALLFGSWKSVELIRITNGVITMHLPDNQPVIMEKGPFLDMRLKSRTATMSDCSCILRPGVDVCVLSTTRSTDGSHESNNKGIWTDARIKSIERKPHGSDCLCQFYINFYVKQGALGSEVRTVSKDLTAVGINQICVLQRLERNPCEDQHYRWGSSEDCSALSQTKLLLGRFLSDLSWLVVASVFKKVVFNVRSIDSKIVYQVLVDNVDSLSSNSYKNFDSVNFKQKDGILVPFVSQFFQKAITTIDHSNDSNASERSQSSNSVSLRRSKRQNLQPERYYGCDEMPELDIGFVRTRPYKVGQYEDDELFLPLAYLFGKSTYHSEEKMIGELTSSNVSDFEKVRTNKDKLRFKRSKSGTSKPKELESQLAIVPMNDESDSLALDLYRGSENIPENSVNGCDDSSSKYCSYLNINPSLQKKDINLLGFGDYHRHTKNPDPETLTNEVREFYPRHNHAGSALRMQKKNFFDLEERELGSMWEGSNSNKRTQPKTYHQRCSTSQSFCEERTCKGRSLDAGPYRDLINSLLKNINTTTIKDPSLAEQWKQHKEQNSARRRKEMEADPEKNEEVISEIDLLWREMELCLASSYLTEDNDDPNAAEFMDTGIRSSELCEHDYRLDEQIGIFCIKCGFVSTEIRNIATPVMQHTIWHTEKQQHEEDPENKPDAEDYEHLVNNNASADSSVSEGNETVWALIPELREKLHVHQKKAFEFLWKNIAGSTEPAQITEASKNTGGCVISHTPGAGKTFLIIAFLVSYLKLFPGKRPLILAPKSTLYTWWKEFIKWEIPIPVYLLHGRQTYRAFKQDSIVLPGAGKPGNDVKHVVDCLQKIRKWHAQPSILVMGYTSFLTLMREDAKYAYRKYMAKVLRESPGILILDEGHNPRSTKSRLRKALMKVETEMRVLLSGTLFQNNFCEYFNTLCLARPKFVHEVLKALNPKYKKNKKTVAKARFMESRARKHFLDTIAKKIDSNVNEERMQGLNMLRNMTSGFIDVYDGVNSDVLPGLQIYTLLMNSTDIQHVILNKLHKIMYKYTGYPLELELMITLGSIHPWLVKTAVCAEKFLDKEELMLIEKYKYDLKKGAKIRFVLSLVYRVVRNEKVLIFCHNIAPVRLFVELFEKFFGWQKGKEVLVITGELELFERGKVIDKFEEPGGASRVLLASISSCAEGISLTAASRVILLDSEWNPSKTKQAIARAFRPGQQKMVYVYQLLATGTLEEDKYRRTTWKEWVSSMIFSEEFVEDPSQWQAEKIEDDILREMVEEDRSKTFHMIMKNEKASTS